MQFNLRGVDGRSVAATFENEGEQLVSLRNAMIAKSAAVTVRRFSQSIGSMFYRTLGGAESLLISFSGAPGQYIILGPPSQGMVRMIEPIEPVCVIQSSLLCFENGLTTEFTNPGVSAILAGYGISQAVFSGKGSIGVMGNNYIDEITLENEDIFVDSKHVIGWEKRLEFKIETIRFQGVIGGVASGDLLGAVFRGSGKLWIQSSAK
jgi:uncharacterized protein (AIM24 family)